MYFKREDGLSLFYEIKGNEQSSECIVFLNGVMASTSSWMYQVPAFERLGYKIILHDFKGQLKSDKPQGPYSFHQHAEELKSLLDYLHVNKAHVIGTSYGGEVAMRFALDYPQMVQSLSIIDSVSELDEVLRLFVRSWKALAADMDGEKFFYGMMPSIYYNDFIVKNQAMLAARAKATASASKKYFQGQIYLYETFENDVYMTPELKNIKAPTLVIVGESDILKPVKFSKIIAANIPNSELVIIPECGHVTIFEKPNELNTLLVGFITKNKKVK